MSNLQVSLACVSAIGLLQFGVEGFSRELQRMGGETISNWLERLTQSRWRAVLLGSVATAVIQCSSGKAAYPAKGSLGAKESQQVLSPIRQRFQFQDEYHSSVSCDSSCPILAFLA
jgi:hypothetical protein